MDKKFQAIADKIRKLCPMPTTVYVVTRGSYSDYGIVGIYSTRELAQAFMNASKPVNYDDYNDIEEYELDQFKSKIEQGLICYWTVMQRDGSNATAKRWHVHNDFRYYPPSNQFSGTVWAKDEEHAIKIANERRIAYLLNQQQGAT